MTAAARARPDFRLTVIGSAPAYSRRPGAGASCYLLECGDDAIVLDLGHGSFSALAATREPSTIRAVFVSHEHPDHHIDLVPLRHYLRFASSSPAEVALHAPPDLRRRYDELTGEPGFLDVLAGEDLLPGTRAVGPFRVRAFPVTHTDRSVGFRVTLGEPWDGPGLVYSGDCGRPEELVEALSPGDALLSEASFGAGEPLPGVAHLTARQAAQAGRAGGAARLLLTHVLDEHDPEGALAIGRATFGGPVELARPGLIVALGELPRVLRD